MSAVSYSVWDDERSAGTDVDVRVVLVVFGVVRNRCKPCVNELWKQEVRSVQVLVPPLGPERLSESDAEYLNSTDVGTSVILKSKTRPIWKLRTKASREMKGLPRLKLQSFRKHQLTSQKSFYLNWRKSLFLVRWRGKRSRRNETRA